MINLARHGIKHLLWKCVILWLNCQPCPRTLSGMSPVYTEDRLRWHFSSASMPPVYNRAPEIICQMAFVAIPAITGCSANSRSRVMSVRFSLSGMADDSMLGDGVENY